LGAKLLPATPLMNLFLLMNLTFSSAYLAMFFVSLKTSARE
jgi:hypothetical protein